MKISKLYIKIFLSVLLGLVIAEALMFGAFRGIYRRGFRQEVGAMIDAQAILLRSFIRTRHAAGDSLQEVTVALAEILPGEAWALDEFDQPLAASRGIDAALPELDDLDEEHRTREGVRLDFEDESLIASLPVVYPDGSRGSFIFEFHRGDQAGPGEKTFALALAGVAVAFAFLLYPLSRLLGRPLRELRNSVLRIADGDLNHRAHVRSSDEIGELGRAFNQMADRVERMVDGTRELTAHVSHELRSPLARIRVATELLREGEDGKTARTGIQNARQSAKLTELHESIHEEIEDLDRLIGRILQLSRLDLQAPAPVAPRATSAVLNQLTELADKYRPAFERRGLNFVIEFPESVAGRVEPVREKESRVAISPEDFRTVVSVLLDNAVKYGHSTLGLIARVEQSTETADAKLSILLKNDLAPPGLLDCERIFEPFQRGLAHEETNGEGLGLAIARKVMENAGGVIDARCLESEIVFEIRLPILAN